MDGIQPEELFQRACFLSGILSKEEVQRDRISKQTRPFYDGLIKIMFARKLILEKGGSNICLRIGAETFILFVSSLIWPMVDSYYVTILYSLSMAIGK